MCGIVFVMDVLYVMNLLLRPVLEDMH